jgi:hypothetical protein
VPTYILHTNNIEIRIVVLYKNIETKSDSHVVQVYMYLGESYIY